MGLVAEYLQWVVAVVDQLFKQNGLPTPHEMQQAPLDKIRDIIGADAVLYPEIREWGTSYQLINSQTSVVVQLRLVMLWPTAKTTCSRFLPQSTRTSTFCSGYMA